MIMLVSGIKTIQARPLLSREAKTASMTYGSDCKLTQSQTI